MQISTKGILLALAGAVAWHTCAFAHSYSIDSDALYKSFCSSFHELTLADAAQPTAQDRARYTKADQCPYEGIPYLISADSEDLVDARRCWVATDSEPLGLGLLFANGWGGVQADYDASLYYLCRVDLEKEDIAPFELWIMAEYVDDDMRNADAPKPLTYCDHITSGRGGLTCQQIEASAKQQDEQKRFDALEGALEHGVRELLRTLKASADTFADKQAELREYGSRGGTAHAGMQLGAETKLKEDFATQLERLTQQRAPAATSMQWKEADRALNAEYKRRMAATEACPLCDSNEEPQLLREAQRAWLRYRDAWTAFYTARWKSAAAPADLKRECETLLSTERATSLRLPDGD